ncbi:MAG: right-handed parallel beta-helix repeat-containing protein [Planctomycetota bacterium]|jgi:predicted outer membrane repeat protein
MRKATLITFALLFVITGQASGNLPWWLSNVEIIPQNPTSSDTVYITLSGVWGNSCIPNDSAISRTGNNIYLDVIRDYPPAPYCMPWLSPWQRIESIGPLPEGTYTVYAQLIPDSESYEPVGQFLVTDKQFVLSTESLTVLENSTASFTVALLNEPTETVEVTVEHVSGDPDIVVWAGSCLIFDPCNYSVPQTVTLAAAEDEDGLNGQAIIQVSAAGYLTAELVATESDNDPPPILYVDVNAPGQNDGTSWQHAFTDLQAALSVAAAYPEIKEIRVAQGVYKPAGPNGSRDAAFQLVDGVTIRGGFAGYGQPVPNERDLRVYRTILSGDLNSNDGPNFTNRSDNAYHVVVGNIVGIEAVLDGFSVTGGNGGSGGGVYNYKRCNLTFVNCTFSANRASYGGGLYHHGAGNLTLTNCVLTGNSAKDEGGGLLLSGYRTNLTASNCTFSNNSAGDGGAIFSTYHTGLMLTNCIFWQNRDGGGTDESAQIHGGSPQINYCCMQGWTDNLGGTGNIGDDPNFVDSHGPDDIIGTEDDNLRLLPTSPCIDAGDNISVPNDIADLDNDGNTVEPTP